MRILFKFIFNNIKEKKFMTFLIIFSVAASCALFFASLATSNTFEKTFVNRIRDIVGDTDIVISPNEQTPSLYVNKFGVEKYSKDIDYYIGYIKGSGQFKENKNTSENIILQGYDFNELQRFNPVTFIDKYNLEPFNGDKIIISYKFSKESNLKAGDKISLYINRVKHQFTICGIAAPQGIFSQETENFIAIIPRASLDMIYSANGKYSSILIKVKEPLKKQEILEELKDEYSKYTVSQAVNQAELTQMTNQARVPFLMMLIVVVIISVYIIYTVFKIIILERLPVIGTFRSIGATKKITSIVLILESTIYGIIGGILGLGFGMLLLYFMADQNNYYKSLGIKTVVDFSIYQLIAAFFMAIFISFISSILPILGVSKIPVKDIVLNTMESVSETKVFKLIIGLALVTTSIIVTQVKLTSQVLVINSICLIFVVIGAILLIPYILYGFVFIFQKPFSFIFGNEGIIAIKNLKNNKSIINNISLLAIGISAIFTISTISYSFGKELISAYDVFKYDIYLCVNGATKDTEISALQVDGVENTLGFYASWNVKVVNTDTEIMELDGVRKDKFLDFLNLKTDEKLSDMLTDFDNDRNIIITNILKDRLNVKKGDYITLKLGKKNREYKVIGFFNTSMQNGSFAFIPERYYIVDTNDRTYDHIAVKTNKDLDYVKKQLQNKFSGKRNYIKKISEFKQNNEQEFAQLLTMLNSFSIITALIGIFGILNNFIISFLERKKALAIYKSVGMSKGQTVKILIIESISAGIIGGIVGVSSGALMSAIIPNVTKAMDMPLDVHYSISSILLFIFGGIFITIIASVGPIIKSSKLSIIEALKYE